MTNHAWDYTIYKINNQSTAFNAITCWDILEQFHLREVYH